MSKKLLPAKKSNLSEWYTALIQHAKLADYSPVKGCMVIRPNGYEIWEMVQKRLDELIKDLDCRNAYFPLFIPYSFLQKEKDHIEGFSPELAIVTVAGGEKLEENLVVRPTSETIMYDMYSKWLNSYRDLPIKINQWNNVVRWEKRTYFFLRTTEFLWQEGHTAHATHEESWQMVLDALDAYEKIMHEYLAVPVVKGRKSNKEKFAGADVTTTIESIMPDGKALQAGTSHDLGQNFSKKESFNIAYQNEKGEMDYVWQVSFGLSTRVMGALIMTHGDDDGMVIPPRIAPTQVSIITVNNSEAQLKFASELQTQLKQLGVRTRMVKDNQHSLGWMLNELELEGIPIVIVIGDKEISDESITLNIRHNKTKEKISSNEISKIPEILENIQKLMYEKAQKLKTDLTFEPANYEEFKKIMSTTRGYLSSYWCESEKCETKIKEETKATIRCLPLDQSGPEGECIYCGKKAKNKWLFAQAY